MNVVTRWLTFKTFGNVLERITNVPCTEQCTRLRDNTRQAHCGACHFTFSSVTTFDQHRQGGKCTHPSLWLMIERNGIWGQRMSDETREIRFGHR